MSNENPVSYPSIQEQEQRRIEDTIVKNQARIKMVVGGPGTGKTRLFQRQCEAFGTERKFKFLALSFINELVDDLSLELHGISTVETFHGFALRCLNTKSPLFMRLTDVIQHDVEVAKGSSIEFARAFHELSCTDEEKQTYSLRRRYYDHFGPDCSVFELYLHFQERPDAVPKFDQVMIDEFQDFNPLESALIDLLSSKSPILLAGDDDQALYAFKHSRPENIRDKYAELVQSGSAFQLPYCSRCTSVIVNCFNDVVTKAQEIGLMTGRIQKGYTYIPKQEKDKLSLQYPKLVIRTSVYENLVASQIDAHIQKLIKLKEKPPKQVLVICSLPNKIPRLVKQLKDKGYSNVSAPKGAHEEDVVEGFKILLQTNQSLSNLGYRIVAESLMRAAGRDTEYEATIKKLDECLESTGDPKNQPRFCDLLPPDVSKDIRELATILRKLRDKKPVEDTELHRLATAFKLLPLELLRKTLVKQVAAEKPKRNLWKSTPIKVTSMLKSKGLTYDHVFLAHYDDRYLISKDGITDEDVCKFLVALTRSRSSVTLFTGSSTLPTFVSWISPEHLEVIDSAPKAKAPKLAHPIASRTTPKTHR